VVEVAPGSVVDVVVGRPVGVVVLVVVVDDVVVEEELVEEVLVDEDAVVVVDGGGGGSPSSWRCRESGEASGSARTGTPARPARIRSPKMAAGKLPPVTARPWTPAIGRAGS
jgi:hypothetical protein